MKKGWSLFLVLLLLVTLAACGTPGQGESSSTPEGGSAPGESAGEQQEQTPATSESEALQEETEGETVDQNTFYVTVGGETFAARFAENVGAQAFRELLSGGPVTLSMDDYGGFEKVGALGRSLPASNRQTTTQAGDIVLYQGSQIVMFYGSNSWSYTRLGKVEDLTGWEQALGSGDVSATFSLTA